MTMKLELIRNSWLAVNWRFTLVMQRQWSRNRYRSDVIVCNEYAKCVKIEYWRRRKSWVADNCLRPRLFPGFYDRLMLTTRLRQSSMAPNLVVWLSETSWWWNKREHEELELHQDNSKIYPTRTRYIDYSISWVVRAWSQFNWKQSAR